MGFTGFRTIVVLVVVATGFVVEEDNAGFEVVVDELVEVSLIEGTVSHGMVDVV